MSYPHFSAVDAHLLTIAAIAAAVLAALIVRHFRPSARARRAQLRLVRALHRQRLDFEAYAERERLRIAGQTVIRSRNPQWGEFVNDHELRSRQGGV